MPREGSFQATGPNHLKTLSSSLPAGAGQLSNLSQRQTTNTNPPTNNGPPPALLSRRFVARRISEGETGRLKEELKCQACGKGYKHISSLAKHLWEHTPEWSVTSKLLISKHQQVQLLEAASILVSLNENDEEGGEDEEAAAAAAATNAYLAKQQQQQMQINSRRKSMSTPKNQPDAEDTKSPPITSPSLADDSSTPSPPPQPVTPNYASQAHISRTAQMSYSQSSTSSKVLPVGKIHSRSTSLSNNGIPSSPAKTSSSLITDSLYPSLSSSLHSPSDILSSSLNGTRSSLRYDDLVSSDSRISKRSNYMQTPRRHSTKSYARRMSALNPPVKINTKLSLDYDDEDDDDGDEDNENVVVDDLDDGVFGAMDWAWIECVERLRVKMNRNVCQWYLLYLILIFVVAMVISVRIKQ